MTRKNLAMERSLDVLELGVSMTGRRASYGCLMGDIGARQMDESCATERDEKVTVGRSQRTSVPASRIWSRETRDDD